MPLVACPRFEKIAARAFKRRGAIFFLLKASLSLRS
jgi:hypothetical protein